MYNPKTQLKSPETFNFPFQPYDIQEKFMIELYKIIDSKQIGIFESPTGTGKSLSLICSSLKWLIDYESLIKTELTNECTNLQNEIDQINKNTDKNFDWINEQFDSIQKKEKLFQLKQLLTEILKYDEENLNLKTKINLERKRLWKQNNKETNELFESKKTIDKDDDHNTKVTDGNEIEEEYLIEDHEDNNDEDNKLIENNADDNKIFQRAKIYFCSRTHSQLSQIINEIKNTIYGKSIRVASLASRQNYCINSNVRKLQSNNLINERCLELQKLKFKSKSTVLDTKNNSTIKKLKTETKCDYYQTTQINNLKELCLTDVMDIEELIDAGKSGKSCPYYATRLAAKDAQIILLPYQMLLHKKTRQQIGLNLNNSVIIIDEAHNLLDTLANIYSAEISLGQLNQSHQQLVTYKNKYFTRFSTKNLLRINQLIFITSRLIKLLNIINNKNVEKNNESHRMILPHELKMEGEFFNINLHDILKFCEDTHLAQKIHGYIKRYGYCNIQATTKLAAKTNTKSYLQLLSEQRQLQQQQQQEQLFNKNKKKTCDNNNGEKNCSIDENNDKIAYEYNGSVIRPLLAFLECLMETSPDGRVLITYRTDGLKSKSSLKYLLLNSSGHFDEILKECRALIVAGGTMQPTTEFTEQLFFNHKERIQEHFYGHVVQSNAVLPIAISKGPGNIKFLFNYQNRNDKQMLTDLSMTLQNVCNVIPAGVVCFFSSYDYMEMVYKFLEDTGTISKIQLKKRILKEPKNNSDIEKMLNEYSKAAKNYGAFLFSVVGGKLSEGLNFADDLGRCVIVIGLPFPNKNNPELFEKMKYLEKKCNTAASTEYYENICMKAVNQCIGRAIRHINDYACVLLIDERYQQERIYKKLPNWISCSLKCPQSFGIVQGSLATFFRNKINI